MMDSNFDMTCRLLEVAEHPPESMESYPAELDGFVQRGYPLTDRHYFLMIQLLNIPSPLEPRLDMMSAIIRHPTFICDPAAAPEQVPFMMGASAYWLREDFFNDQAYRKDPADKRLNGQERNVVRYMDLGAVLMEKGFPFPKRSELDNSSVVTPYVIFFTDQVWKRKNYFDARKVGRSRPPKIAAPDGRVRE